jgi:hypothetical protein
MRKLSAAVRAGFIKLDENGNRVGSGLDGCEVYLMWAALNDHKTFVAFLARILPHAKLPDKGIPAAWAEERSGSARLFLRPKARSCRIVVRWPPGQDPAGNGVEHSVDFLRLLERPHFPIG